MIPTGNYLKLLIFLLIINILQFEGAFSQENTPSSKKPPLSRILFVLDASQSMSGTWESDEKINIAREILTDLVDSLEYDENIQMALRVYGHQSPVPPQDCSDTRLEVPFAPGNAQKIRQTLNYITPRGTTPIANSLAMTVNDFPRCNDCRNIIVLITDGIEACDGDPCAVSQDLQKRGIVLKPFVIGIGLDPGFRETFDCVGYYYNAREEEKFKQTLGLVINQALNSTTAQVNLLDQRGRPTETNVAMSFYDRYTGRIMYNYVHTMNNRGNPDTLELDHLMTYRLKINTIPAITVDSIGIEPGKHNIISVSAPQGYLHVKTNRGKEYEGLRYTIRKYDDPNTLINLNVGEVEKIITGKYDIEVPTIPRININDIEILQSHTTTIDLPEPGKVTFNAKNSGHGSVYLLNGEDQEWLFNLVMDIKQRSYYLQPGNYRVVFRNDLAKRTLYTRVFEYQILPGKSISVELY